MSETVHATAVLAGAVGVLIRGAPGAGKSALAATLIGRGARLVADDRVHLSAAHGRLLAAAPGSMAGRMEMRGRGILSVPHERCALIRLIVDIVGKEGLERLPDTHHLEVHLLGIALPRQPVPDVSGHGLILVEAAISAATPQCNTGLRCAPVWG